MIRNHLSRILGERRLSVAAFAVGAGISRNSAHRLYHGTAARIDLPTMDRTCRYLGIRTCELFEYVPDAREGAPDAP